jgi:type IV secretory pathway protease TraF
MRATDMKIIKRITAIALILMTAAAIMVVFTACSDDSAVGFWIVQKVTAGDVVMNEQDAESIGLNAVGTIKLQKSGNCEINLLGEEATGKWEKAKDGTITINYGDKQSLSGSIDDKGVMTLTDPQGAEYILAK